MRVQLCPECRAGKHRNCDGTGWDIDADERVPCPCPDESHTAPILGVAYPEEESNGRQGEG
jgi:hypothetical protein